MARSSGRLEMFYVPSAFIKMFARLIQHNQLENNLSGLEGDELVFFVRYNASKQKVIDIIHRKIEKYRTDQKNEKWKLNGL
jgi:hypothetical protein